MALQSAYNQFLAAPNPTLLAENASLHYITTLVTYNGPEAIIKHLKTQGIQILKKAENILDVVEGQNGLVVEVETTMEFVSSGGAYLPKLDDNFLADRVVTFPIIHIVSFDEDGLITQVRQNWDQGSLLKLIDVIGKTGRNWPIRDGKDQIKLIVSSVKSAGKPVESTTVVPKKQDETVKRSRENSTNVTRDPHASLALFAPREHVEQDSLPAVIAPRASAKPPPRDYHDLFVGQDSDASPAAASPSINRERSSSPSKHSAGIAPKGGAGRNYQPSRLFDNDENSPIRPQASTNHSADHFYRPNPKKYQHFDFADGTDPQDAPKPALLETKKSKHGSQWNFDDFNTPQKNVPTKVLGARNVKHWGNDEDDIPESPVLQKKVDKPRKDAETHFEFVDDGTPEGTQRLIGRPRGAGGNVGMGLYKNNLYNDDGEQSPPKPESRALGNIANVKDRRKDFDPHFAMTDDSPSTKETKAPEKLSDDKLKAVKMMDANWSAYDHSPSGAQKENAAPVAPTSPSRVGNGRGPLSESTNTVQQGISVAGDGMGSRKGNVSRKDEQKGISIGGDGMGGKKGAGRAWGFGDDSDGEEAGGVNGAGGKFQKGVPGKRQGNTAQSGGGDFWDF